MKKVIIRILAIIMILVISSTIFGFSNQNAEESSSISEKVAECLINIQPKYKNITKQEKEKLIEVYQHPIRKLAHFTIYTALGISIAMLTYTYNLSNKKRMLITIASGALYATSDEIHQIFISGRSGQVSDVLLDTSGIIFGYIIILIIWGIYNKFFCNKNVI